MNQMPMTTKDINKIVIVGRDVDAWITALFLKNSLDKPDNNIEVELVELPSQLNKHDFYSVLPSYKTLHTALGAHEKKLAQSAKARHFFAQRFSGWNNNGPDFMLAYDKIGVNFNSVDFYQYWLKASELGLKVSLEEFCLGACAAKHNVNNIYADPNSKQPELPGYGYHLSAISYIQAIRNAAIAYNLKHTQSEIKNVIVDGQHIQSIELENGQTVHGDLFIDASGHKAELLSYIQTDNFTSWADSFICDRVITTSVTAFHPSPTFSQITAFSSGWYGFYPLQDCTGLTIYYSSKHNSKEKVISEVSTLSQVPMGDLTERTIESGITTQPWIGNCVAVGSAVANLEALDALQLQPLVSSLVQLRELFPTNNQCHLEAKIYNQKLHAYLNSVRDYQQAHYKLNGRQSEAFWDECRDIAISQSLAEKIELFSQIGQVSNREYDTFLEESWTLLFNGHGLKTEKYSPLVDKVPDDDLKQQFVYLLQKIGQDTKRLMQ